MALNHCKREIGEEEPATFVFLDMTITGIDQVSALKSGMETVTGLIVTAVRWGSPAHFAGVETGDIISEIDGDSVITLKDLEHSLAAREPGAPIKVLFRRIGTWRFTTLPVA